MAIRYTLSRWEALIAYLDDGRLELSNNAAENALCTPVTLGRKNWAVCRVRPRRGTRRNHLQAARHRAVQRPRASEACLRHMLDRVGPNIPSSIGSTNCCPGTSLRTPRKRDAGVKADTVSPDAYPNEYFVQVGNQHQ